MKLRTIVICALALSACGAEWTYGSKEHFALHKSSLEKNASFDLAYLDGDGAGWSKESETSGMAAARK